jgi:hypothetical protein
MAQLAYRDTRNFAPVDVTKGVDLITKEVVAGDDPAPADYEKMPKCKFCKNYTETETNIGICEASMNDPKFMAYGDMPAITCGMYEEK